ncbi:hypothetical protein [uncultured Lacinutrix sp.]|uniref:hypothetical protein n=1 Tax=uncultured Lacinutrix sp. TaxID=574032 RepID=UPI00263295B2|nr:hypothetical protein [uncultured Lacinutrix sp.]
MSKLSKKELAALDLLIAHVEENGTQDLAFIGSIVNAASKAVNAVTNVVSNPAVTSALNVATAVCPVAVAAILAARPAETSKLESVDAKTTLNELIQLRKENS